MDDKEIYAWIKQVVRGFAKSGLEIDELVSVGYLGYADAKERFDESNGASFKTFAEYRILFGVHLCRTIYSITKRLIISKTNTCTRHWMLFQGEPGKSLRLIIGKASRCLRSGFPMALLSQEYHKSLIERDQNSKSLWKVV